MKAFASVSFLAVSIAGTTAFALTPRAVKEFSNSIKTKDVRTVITKVENKEGNPCMPNGFSYNIELQVKMANYNRESSRVEYTWQTVKTVNTTRSGRVSEVCAE